MAKHVVKRCWREILERFRKKVPVGGWFFLQEAAKVLQHEYNLRRVQQGRELVLRILTRNGFEKIDVKRVILVRRW